MSKKWEDTLRYDKKRSEKLILRKKYKTTIKETWQVIKEALGKEQVNSQIFPNKIVLKKKNITKIESIAFWLKLVQI